MGFQFSPKSYALKFADGDLQGLEVTMGSLSIADLLRMDLTFDATPEDPVEAAVGRINERLEIFAGALQSWNLEDTAGQPVGTSVDEVKAQPSSLILRIIREWWTALEAVPPPLPDGSSDTPASDLEQSIPMTAASSPSPPN